MVGKPEVMAPIGLLEITSGLLLNRGLGLQSPTLKASGYDPRFGRQTTQGQSAGFARRIGR
jgi:hypothetical protein